MPPFCLAGIGNKFSPTIKGRSAGYNVYNAPTPQSWYQDHGMGRALILHARHTHTTMPLGCRLCFSLRYCPGSTVSRFMRNFAQFHKRHGRSSSMRHGLAIVVVGGLNLGSPSHPGAFGSALATAPCSIPPHHRYRRWMGGVSRLHIFPTHTLHLGKQNAQHQHTSSSAPRHRYCRPTGGASPPQIPFPSGFELATPGQQTAAQPVRREAKT